MIVKLPGDKLALYVLDLDASTMKCADNSGAMVEPMISSTIEGRAR